MATRSRKPAEPKPSVLSRVATAGTSATRSATAPKRATRSTRNVATPTEEPAYVPIVTKVKTVAKKVVAEKPKPVASVVKKAPARTKTKTLATVDTEDNDREPIKVIFVSIP